MKSKSYLKALSFVLLLYLPNIVFAQWDTGGNLGLPEVKSYLGTMDNINVKFITNNIERMRLAPNGNFGIGTDNPQRILHVNGSIRFQNLSIGTQTTALMIDANGDLSLRALNNVAFSGNYNDLQNLPSLNIANWNTAYSWGNHAGLYKPIDWLPTWDDVNGKPDFATVATTGNYNDLQNLPSLNIANWNESYSWGNHAGLYKPIDWLPTWDDVNDKPDFATVATTGNYNDLINTPTLFDGNWSSLQGTAPAISSFANDVGYITSADDADADPTNEIQNLKIRNGFLEISDGNRVSLANLNYWSKSYNDLYYNKGKVGIGTSKPRKLLHLHSVELISPFEEHEVATTLKNFECPIVAFGNYESALLLTNKKTGSTSADGLLIRSFDNDAIISLQEEGNLSITTLKPLQFKMRQNGTVSIGTQDKNYFTVNESGKVNIGDQDNDFLTVNESGIVSIGIQDKNYFTVNESGKVNIGDQDNNFLTVNESGIVSIGTQNENFFIVKENGNVEIGTNDPEHYSDVNGNLRIKKGWGGLIIEGSGTNPHRYEFILGDLNGNTDCSGGFSIFDRNAHAYRFAISRDGNIGIGTVNPQYKLDVRGTGHFCKIKVKTQGFCDYVFSDDYKLMPLDELSEFIKINKHLPNIPSEKEVMEEGSFDLGEINKVLLEKIEELTLYILQQEERIKALEAEVKK